MAAGQTLTIEVVTQHAKAVTGLNQVQKATAGVSSSVKSATAEMKRHASQYNSTAVATNKFAKGALQQAGYQVGDFVVQIQNGTNVMQAFGQQGSQMAGVFGPVGAVIGAGIAIFSSLAIAIQKSTGAGKSFTEALDDASSALDSYLGMVSQISDAHAKMVNSVKAAVDGNSTVIKQLIEIERSKAFDAVLKLSDAMYDVVAPSGFFNVSLNENVTRLVGISNTSSSARRALKQLGDSFVAMKNAGDLEGQYQAATRLREQFDALVGPVSGMNAEQKSFYTNLLQSIQRMELLGMASARAETVIEDVKKQALSLVDAQYMVSQGILPPQALDDFRTMETSWRRIRTEVKGASTDVAEFGKTTLSAAEATYMLNRNILPPQARADLETLDKSYETIRARVEAAGKASSESFKNTSKIIKTELTPEMKRAIEAGDMVGQSMENAMMGAVNGTMSVKDAFRSMAAEIISELFRIFVVKQITGFISGAVTGAFGGSAVPAAPMPRPSFAGGGYTGNGARSGGLDGKGGFMAMLHPRETVVDHTRGNGAGGVIVQQTINVSTGVQQTVRNEIQTLLPQIAEASKAAVLDARRRGGSFANAF